MRTENSGLYILVIKMDKCQRLKNARFPETIFKEGLYLYIGRAKQGLQNRLDCHLRKRKKVFWRIDYILQKSTIAEVWVKYGSLDECRTVRKIKGPLINPVFPQKHFGASDCRCSGHFFLFA